MLKHTQFVLDETEFFLNKLKDTQENFPHFNYYLNAYISAARSVLWIMKSEYNNVSGWLEWYDSIQIDQDKKFFLKGIVDMRNRSLKKEPLQIKEEFIVGGKDVSYNLYDELQPLIGKKVHLTIEQLEHSEPVSRTITENSLILKGKMSKINSVSEFKDQDVLNICQQYFNWLKEIVEMCIAQFG